MGQFVLPARGSAALRRRCRGETHRRVDTSFLSISREQFVMQKTPAVGRRVVRGDDLGLVRVLAIPCAVGGSLLVAAWGAYLFAIGMLCLGVGLALCVLPERAPTGRRLRAGLGFIYASAAFVLLQLVAYLLAYRGA